MAIKGKKRSKPKSAARPPRHEPVPLPTPIWARRWVQVTAAFALGLAAVWLLVIITNSLRASSAKDEAAADAQARRVAAQKWQTEIQSTFTPIAQGELPRDGTPPTLFPDLTATLAQIQGGKPPEGAAKTLGDVEDQAQKVSKEITDFGLSDVIRDHGFDTGGALRFFESQDALATALRQYERAAALGKLAATTEDPGVREQLAAQASTLAQDATSTLATAWRDYVEALDGGGILLVPTPPTAPGSGTTPIG
jgi:hypothetical protein